MKLNFAGRIARFFLLNRPLTILILLTTIGAGIVSYQMTHKQYNPTITLPAFQIETNYPGATAEEVERFITQELEEKISDIEGVDKLFGQSFEGKSILQVQFLVGKDVDSAKIKVRQKIEENFDLLAFSMEHPLIKNIDPDSVPIVTIGFQSKSLSQNQVRPLALEILNELRRVQDIANLQVHGGEAHSLKVILDPLRLHARNISIDMVRRALQSSNVQQFVGTTKTGKTLHEIQIDGIFTSAQDAEKIVIVPGVQLRDIAEVTDSFQEKTSFVQVQTLSSEQTLTLIDTVFLSFAKREGSNSITVANEALNRLDQVLKNSRYGELETHIFRNDATVAQNAIGNLLKNLLTSVLIVSAVLLIFLGFRSAFVVAIAIPLTIALVFLIGLLWGESINRITLFALILSLGLLVDNATVIVENIHRHFHQGGKDKKEAIITAVNEVGIGLFISTLTSVIVFLPTSYITGMMGEYMRPLSFFVPVALILSLMVAYVLTPFLADIFLTQRADVIYKEGFFDRVADKYGILLEKLLSNKKLKKRFLGIIFGAFLLVLTFPVLKLVHFKMLPSADKEQFFVLIDTPEGTDITMTKLVSDRVVNQIVKNLEVQSVQSFVGEPSVVDFNGLFRGAHLRQGRNLTTLRVNLSSPDERSEESTDILIAVRKQVSSFQKQFTSPSDEAFVFQNTTLKFVEDPPGPPVRATLEAKVKGPDREILEQVARDIERIFSQEPDVQDIDTTLEYPAPRTVLSVDHEKALQAGVSAVQISETLQGVLNSTVVSQYHLPNQYEMALVEMEFPLSQKDQIQDLGDIYLPNAQGEMVPFLSVVRSRQSRNQSVLLTDDQEPTVLVNAEMGGRSVVYAVIDMIPQILKYQFPQGGKLIDWNLFGFTFETETHDQYFIQWGGEWEMTLENFRDLGIAMVVAFFLIYIVLVAQFQSFLLPLLVMTTMPLGFLGILPGFAILDAGWGTFLTATSLIGFIALMGIVVNNAIMYLEYFDILREQGVEFHQSLIQAGKTRLRPIILTSATTVLGNLTIASDPVWSGLAWSIVFGLSLSAVLTLGVFPLLYDFFRPAHHMS
ncbi:efflux RND transporter permease subunit [Candidatus Gracilibacteria bacterium]|nr:efflux RND transporter permease subunit [Candidatus Gracilibacteria bacterium]